ncbi:AI-2E family transporter [Bulleidia sp. zg-1006]|uniref:AI-2E family transporter n=1 Tax=Bulleidia sp. zg-1006 TaxID=2806552 RepID=UPI00193A2A76|nr:AI-2E family transporter [Bulleidia sp. zg-1006]QRG86318.1 AI-2E family transporter [Bulleidia sp. zg-1006]
MNWKNIKPETREQILSLTISGMILIVFYFAIRYIPFVMQLWSSAIRALMPFVFGFIFAFLLNPIRKIIEYNVLKPMGWTERMKRMVASFISIIIFLLILIGFFSILIPQLYASVQTFSNAFPGYMQSGYRYLESLPINLNEVWNYLNATLQTFLASLQKWLTLNTAGGISQLYYSAVSFARGILDFLIGIIIAFYILLDEEKLKSQLRKVVFSLVPFPRATSFFSVCRMVIDTFNNFIAGKALDSLIIGIVCYVGCLLLRIPYAPLVSVIIGVTNMIPVFGPFIGGIPLTIMIILINPWRGLTLGLFIFILQQVDGNIIGPRILGSAVGLPSIWVMFSIIAGGAMFGIVGMIIGVPLFSVIYVLLRNKTTERLKEKKIHLK